MRNIIFSNSEYYHIYNRGVDKRDIFLDKQDYWKFFDCLRDFNNTTYYDERLEALGMSRKTVRILTSEDFKQLGEFLGEQEKVVDVLSYNLIRNHFHIKLKQIKDNGVSNFMHKVGLAYTQYFNRKHNRSGALFEGAYKIIHIDNESYFLWLIGYINGNIEIHGLGEAEDYSWSSYRATLKALKSKPQPLGGLQSQEKPPTGLQGKPLSNLSVLSGLEDIVLSQFSSESEFKSFVEQVIVESRNKKEMKKYLLEEL